MHYVHEARVSPEILGWADELAEIRQSVHRHPEIGFETPITCTRITSLLTTWGIQEIDDQIVKGGVIAVIRGDRPGKTIALRADIDALVMPDTNGRPWQSEVQGRAHACGHDGHLTWLLGTCRYLQEHRNFPGAVVAVFQPAEEPAGGARAVVDAGVFKKYGVCEIFGAHDDPTLPKGTFGFRPGPLMASSDTFWIKIHAAGGHGARPHLGGDPIPAGVALVEALQTIITRKVNAIEPAVLSVCSINAGRFETQNVMPNLLTMCGTVRAYSEPVRDLIQESVTKMTASVADVYGCTSELKYDRGIPPVDNDKVCTADAIETAESLFGRESVIPDMTPFMSSEDFSVYQKEIPGVMIRIGIRDESHAVPLHNSSFDFNDEVLPAACTFFCALTKKRLEKLAAGL